MAVLCNDTIDNPRTETGACHLQDLVTPKFLQKRHVPRQPCNVDVTLTTKHPHASDAQQLPAPRKGGACHEIECGVPFGSRTKRDPHG